MYRIGVVSFLNSRPLVAGLAARADLTLVPAVPADLPGLLDRGAVDASLVPTVDILRHPGAYSVISDACIGCDGETMTVRVFSDVPPAQVRTLAVDGDSHTSVVLATLLWRQRWNRRLELRPLAERAATDATLLIGDKVVAPDRRPAAYEIDLGGAWHDLTGLPFVFAVWAARAARAAELAPLGAVLSAARDVGVADVARIAREAGPQHGWPVPLAERYLGEYLRFRLTPRQRAGADHFAELCRAAELVPPTAAIPWATEVVGAG
jgi:chorismate dehydratase